MKHEICVRNFTKLCLKDSVMVLNQRNSFNIRSNMANTNIILFHEHMNFCKSLFNNSENLYYLIYFDNEPIAVIDFQSINNKDHSYEPGCYFFDSCKNSIVRTDVMSVTAFIRKKYKLYYPFIKVRKTNLQALLFNTMKMGCKIDREDDNYYYLNTSEPQDKTSLEKMFEETINRMNQKFYITLEY